MTLIRKWVWVLCLAWLPLNYSNAQDLVPGQQYTTQNIVQQTQQGGPSTWTNGVYQNSLTCWTWGNPGYCGPNAIVRPGNNINFSFGQTDLYQSQAIASVLPATTGLRVNGYNFSFTAKNGNGWDDGRVDYLYAYTHFTNQNNQVVSYNTYNLTNKFNWTTFNFSETFATPFVASDLKNVTYGFVGRDNNGWAGPYGPEVNNISFQLKYSVDPCATNPLYSPSCPGYLDAINKLAPKITAQLESQPQQVVVTAEPVTIAAAPTAAASQPAATTATTVPTIAQQTTQKQNTQPSIGTILSIITGVQAQVSRTERSVVQQAVQEAIKQGEKATQEAEATSSKQNQLQQETLQTQQNLQTTTIQQTFVNTLRQDFSLQAGNQNQRINTSLTTMTGSNVDSFSQNLPQQTTAIKSVEPQQVLNTSILPSSPEQPQQQQTTSIYSLVPQQQQQLQQPNTVSQSVSSISVLQPKVDQLPEVNTEQKQVIGPTNLLEKFLDTTPNLENVSTQPSAKPLNKQAQDSELAAGSNIAAIAKQPQGFETYMAVLQDVPFYAPTQVYQNQRTVDNQRAMRGLSGASDIRHKELVDSQYRR